MKKVVEYSKENVSINRYLIHKHGAPCILFSRCFLLQFIFLTY